ncbi:MAG: protoheme IX farnesyltransferase [Deltaproteobacteria bacterium]|nr:protoheme IX farnesyltransferase [Deltaproteobacteria bacterium]
MLNAYWQLTKPRISLLFAVTGLTAFVVHGALLREPVRLALLTLAVFLIGGAANTFNQYFERDIDKQMRRTAKKRPLPLGLMTPRAALLFGIVLGLLGVGLLWWRGTPLGALLGLGTILFYGFYYTLWLKPRTPYNIVIGGAAGAAAPLIAWAAVTGRLDLVPILLFLLIFFWTPPHFWALALCCREDYARVALPMLPIVAGEEETRRQIFYYSLILLPLSLGLAAVHPVGWLYLGSAGLLGALFIWFAWRLLRDKTDRAGWRLFGFSILYVLLLFLLLMVDVLFMRHG